MSISDCCFLTCIQVSQEADQVVWYSHLFQNFPQFIVIHTVKGFGLVNKAEIVHLLLNMLKCSVCHLPFTLYICVCDMHSIKFREIKDAHVIMCGL